MLFRIEAAIDEEKELHENANRLTIEAQGRKQDFLAKVTAEILQDPNFDAKNSTEKFLVKDINNIESYAQEDSRAVAVAMKQLWKRRVHW